MDEKVWQEFYCHRCLPKGNYIMVKLNMALNHRVAIVCPKCNSRHERVIENGAIVERGSKTNNYTEEICPTLSACSETPRTKHMEKKNNYNKREGAVIKSSDDLIRDQMMQDRWIELYGGNQ